ncbi:Alpha/Beta hydrolase protein [Mycena haematopus]|nr:Alpha/Beta hydrolase protein [Mycena haematopus]
MNPVLSFCAFLALFLSASVASPVLSSRAISSSLYEDFVLYTKYSSAAYQRNCQTPVGRPLVHSAYIARDDERKELVLVFRGTFSLKDALTDVKIKLVPFASLGIDVELVSVNVHRGFLAAYNDVAEDIVNILKKELEQYPTYRIIVTGGALAALAAPSLKGALDNTTDSNSTHSVSQPRSGNEQFARYVENTIGEDNIFRDGVPTMVPRIFGYRHFATEYWQFRDPIFPSNAPDTVKQCVGGEDPTCSNRILMALNPTLCL